MNHKLTLAIFLLIGNSLFGQTTSINLKVDQYIQERMRQKHLVGLSVAILQDGKLIKATGYGLANAEIKVRATDSTVYKIASVSKQFFGAAIMLLVQDGKLALEDKVKQYIAEAPDSWNQMTLRHLLNHSSGLLLDVPTFDPFKSQPDSILIRSLFTSSLLFKPGENFQYSNAGYFVVADIIRRVSGKGWDQFMSQRLFSPVGMMATRPTTTIDLVPNRADGYVLTKEGFPSKAEDWIAVRPSGAFLSTVLDLAKWDTALFSDQLLTQASRAQLVMPLRLANDSMKPYGLGWALGPWQGHQRIWHNGGLPGFSADVEHFTDDRLTVIVLCNTDGREAEAIAREVAQLVLSAVSNLPQKP